MTTCQYRAGVYVLEGGQAHIICNDTLDEHTPHKHASTSVAASPPSSMTQGLGQLRYLGGRCVAKLQYATVTRLRRHMHINSTAYRIELCIATSQLCDVLMISNIKIHTNEFLLRWLLVGYKKVCDFEYELHYEGHNINLSQNIVLHYLTLDHIFAQNHMCYDLQMYRLSYEGLNFPFINWTKR